MYSNISTVIVTAAVHRGFGLPPGQPTANQQPSTYNSICCLLIVVCWMLATQRARLNLPALGRPQPVYLLYWSLHRPVFLINSPSAFFWCRRKANSQHLTANKQRRSCKLEVRCWKLPTAGYLPKLHPVVLPNSLRRVLPTALVFSTNPPVSVYGTGAN